MNSIESVHSTVRQLTKLWRDVSVSFELNINTTSHDESHRCTPNQYRQVFQHHCLLILSERISLDRLCHGRRTAMSSLAGVDSRGVVAIIAFLARHSKQIIFVFLRNSTSIPGSAGDVLSNHDQSHSLSNTFTPTRLGVYLFQTTHGFPLLPGTGWSPTVFRSSIILLVGHARWILCKLGHFQTRRVQRRLESLKLCFRQA